MKCYKLLTCILGFALALRATATAADAPPLTFKFTTVNVPGARQTFPSGVNNAGVIVGQYVDKNGASHGYIMDGKKLITLDDPNGSATACIGVNLNGAMMVVGAYNSASGNVIGFLYKGGKFTDIPGPTDAVASVATGINDSGSIVGWYADQLFVHGFLLKGNNYTTLDVPGATGTLAEGINNGDEIVVNWSSKGLLQSSLYRGKTYKTINVPGATQSGAAGINTAGDVVYQWLDSNGLGHGALHHGRKYYKFGYPKSAQSYAQGINDRHVIVGGYQTKSNKSPNQGFKASY
jgi:uncharacterized membrane protein